MCTSMIRENYGGNPLKLQSFLTKIDLVEDLTETNLQITFMNFIKSKPEGKAFKTLLYRIENTGDIKKFWEAE